METALKSVDFGEVMDKNKLGSVLFPHRERTWVNYTFDKGLTLNKRFMIRRVLQKNDNNEAEE